MASASLRTERLDVEARRLPANENLYPEPLASEPNRADDALSRGLARAKQGMEEEDDELLEAACKDFEAAIVEARRQGADTLSTTAFEWRMAVNLATVLRRLGRADEAVTKLEGLRQAVTGEFSGLLDAPRALDALGSAYADQAQAHSDQVELKAEFTEKAIAAYRQALAILGRTSHTRNPPRALLHAQVLINLAVTLVDAGDLDPAIATNDNALEVISQRRGAEWAHERARAQRIRAEALSAKAELCLQEDKVQALQLFQAAIKDLERARGEFETTGSAAWDQITLQQASAESRLGEILLDSEDRNDIKLGISHSLQAVGLFSLALPFFVRRGQEQFASAYIVEAMVPLGPYIFSSAYGDTIIRQINKVFTWAGLILGRMSREKIITDFLTSLDISEAEAIPLLSKSFQNLGWSSRITSPQTEDKPSVRQAATEIARRADNKGRAKWGERSGDDLALTPPDFIRKAYSNEIAANTLDTGLIHREDSELYQRLKSWLRTHKMPQDLHIANTRAQEKEANTRKLEEVGPLSLGRLLTRLRREGNAETRELIRLFDLQQKRDRRASRPKTRSPKRSRKGPAP